MESNFIISIKYLYLCHPYTYRPGAGTGRQAWLRAMCPYGRAGSTPAPGTQF